MNLAEVELTGLLSSAEEKLRSVEICRFPKTYSQKNVKFGCPFGSFQLVEGSLKV